MFGVLVSNSASSAEKYYSREYNCDIWVYLPTKMSKGFNKVMFVEMKCKFALIQIYEYLT